MLRTRRSAGPRARGRRSAPRSTRYAPECRQSPKDREARPSTALIGGNIPDLRPADTDSLRPVRRPVARRGRTEGCMALQGSILGNPVKRKEDPGILTGVTQYFDDLAVDGLTHIAFVRSPIAHATVGSI